MATLIVRDGPLRGQRFEVDSGEVSIGREDTEVIIEDDTEVSRSHAVVRPTADGLEIEDQGSTNGTFVNEQQISGSHRCLMATPCGSDRPVSTSKPRTTIPTRQASRASSCRPLRSTPLWLRRAEQRPQTSLPQLRAKRRRKTDKLRRPIPKRAPPPQSSRRAARSVAEPCSEPGPTNAHFLSAPQCSELSSSATSCTRRWRESRRAPRTTWLRSTMSAEITRPVFVS